MVVVVVVALVAVVAVLVCAVAIVDSDIGSRSGSSRSRSCSRSRSGNSRSNRTSRGIRIGGAWGTRLRLEVFVVVGNARTLAGVCRRISRMSRTTIVALILLQLF